MPVALMVVLVWFAVVVGAALAWAVLMYTTTWIGNRRVEQFDEEFLRMNGMVMK